MLLAEETESTKEIRRNICCKLAETLLYGCSEGKYTKPGKLVIIISRCDLTKESSIDAYNFTITNFDKINDQW